MQQGNNQIIIFLIVTTFLIVLLLGLIVSILFLYQQKRILFHEQLSQSQLEMQEETFQNIAREIHDNIGLTLTLAKLNLNMLILNHRTITRGMIESSVELISQAINDLSDISKNLNSEAICREGFISVLEMKLEKIRKLKKFDVKFEIIGQAVFMHSHNELILFRITQEAINNIIKHSQGNLIDIRLNYEASCVELSITDNGIGINWENLEKTKNSKMPAGINNMRKRAKMINGTCHIKSDNSGTTINILIPLISNEK